MTPGSNKILAEIIEDEPKTQSKVLVSAQDRYDSIKVKVLGVGSDVKGVKEGDELIVFNVYKVQIQEYNGKRLVFVVESEGFYYKT